MSRGKAVSLDAARQVMFLAPSRCLLPRHSSEEQPEILEGQVPPESGSRPTESGCSPRIWLPRHGVHFTLSVPTVASAGTPSASLSAGSSLVMTSALSKLTTACSTSTSVPSGSVALLNPNASSSTPSDEGRDELEALAKDGELLPRSLDLTVTQVLYRSQANALTPSLHASHQSIRSRSCRGLV